MRLTTIRLAGFKSFVEPTTLALGSNLSAVVGPNGCGKSNVIDAVRWVTGESSARQLRGEALDDVIFNGCRARKPLGRASVELKFDNSDATLSGQYGAYSEIAVKRELVRDGGSRYLINGGRARRRDVVDLFLGTGLGGRSNYAVIEQGALHRLIEAKPEDMRQVLEEAAGISKYKQRRRETENRLGHTRENIARLDDQIREIAQRVQRLERQAADAEKYKRLKADERRLRGELLALGWAAENKRAQAAETHLRGSEDRLRKASDAQRQARLRRDAAGAEQQTATARVQATQAEFYDAQSRVTRIAQQRAHARELAALRERERADLVDRIAALKARLAEDDQTRKTIESERANAQAEREHAAARAEHDRQVLAEAHDAAREAEAAWEAHTGEQNNPAARLEGERTRARDAEARLKRLQARAEQRRGERDDLGEAAEPRLEAAERALEARAERLAERTQRAGQAGERDQALRAEIETAERAQRERTTELAETRARLAAAKKRQQAALREDDDTLAQWLTARGHAPAEGVVHRVSVCDPWRTAAEAALGPWLDGFVVEALPAHAKDWPDRSLTLLEDRGEPAQADPAPATGLPCLAQGLRGPAALVAAARRFRVVDDLERGLALRGDLGPDEYLVTPDGFCIGRHSLVTPAGETSQHGVLERERRIGQLTQTVERRSADIRAREQDLETLANRHRQAREHRQELEKDNERETRALETARAEHDGARVRAQQQQRRRDEIQDELADIDAQIAAVQADARRAATRVDELAASAKAFESARQQSRQTLDAARGQLDAARRASDTAENQRRDTDTRVAQLAARGEALAEQAQENARTRQTLAAQLERFDAEHAARLGQAPADSEHKHARQAQDEAERQLRAARAALKTREDALAQCAQTLMEAEAGVDDAREALQQARVAAETAGVRRAGLAEQIEALGETAAALLENLAEDALAEQHNAQLAGVETKIQRLGAINLAAIDEYDAEAEREAYLRGQRNDLTQALDTLTAAITRIDRETRDRFKATFAQINERFAALFPELFAGGQAALELTENDWLATGVRIMARPPGKRNASIQMLSGGEKALTAVALLFALFEINPAPFCMLDEIDAPLDDANVARFCELVRRMSAKVQFIMITHNKLTMALAEQLHGVTMVEPGVSRLVSVDIDAALDLAG